MSKEERIAARLIAAIDALIPASCTVAIHPGRLDFAFEGRWEVSMGLGIDGRPPEVLAFCALSTVQDAIVRSVRQPWPPGNGPTDLPIPEAVVREGRLVAWFGAEACPAVAIPPIDLTTV